MALPQKCCQICKRPRNTSCREALDSANTEIQVKGINCMKRSDEKLILKDYKTEQDQSILDTCPNKVGCLRCKLMIKQIRSILQDVKDLERNDGVCNHCKNINTARRCKRCCFLVQQYEKETIKDCSYVLNKISLFLEKIQSHQCRSIEFFPYAIEELREMFEAARISFTNQMPISELLVPDHLNTRKVGTSKVLDADKLMKEKELVLSPPIERQCFDKIISTKLYESLPRTIKYNKTSSLQTNLNRITNNSEKPTSILDNKSHQTKQVVKGSKNRVKAFGDSDTADVIQIKHKYDRRSELFMKMILQEKKSRKKPVINYKSQKSRIEHLEQLRPIPSKEIKELPSEESSSILVCDNLKPSGCTEVIKGTKIRRVDSSKLSISHRTLSPLLYEVQYGITNSISKTTYNAVEDTSLGNDSKHNISTCAKNLKSQTSGKVKYQLSDSKYIDNGWTVLPTSKTLRRMNVFKMIPSHPEYNWIEKYKNKKYTRYDSGEKLSETADGGNIAWYYRDGSLALNYSVSKDIISSDNCTVYDSMKLKMKNKNERRKDVVLARFDKNGHGVVYDRNGNIRLKYNQSEGVIFDENVGPFAHWKWNTLNDPPALHQVLEEKNLNPFDDSLYKLIKKTSNNCLDNHKNVYDKEMYAIELENAIRETSKKVTMNYKPFEIRYKFLKLNEYFTLKIVDQSKIHLQYRDREVSFKFNLGLKLISNEIIGTEFGDLTDVVTPYNKMVLDQKC